MRNRIISVIIIVSIALLAYAMFHGIKIGEFEILSLSQIKEKNNGLHSKIDEAATLASEEYIKNIDTLNNSFEEYSMKKEKYEQLAGFTKDNATELYETKQYDISYLWRVLGNYAKKRNLTLGIDVQNSTRTKGAYNFNFTVAGEYVKIIQFISDLENDSDLYFRIYNFKMNGDGTKISSSFSVENINIDPSTIKSTQADTTDILNTKK